MTLEPCDLWMVMCQEALRAKPVRPHAPVACFSQSVASWTGTGTGDPRGTALDPRGARPLKLALCGILAAVINIEEAKKTTETAKRRRRGNTVAAARAQPARHPS